MSVLFGLSFRFSLGYRLRPGTFCRFCGCLGFGFGGFLCIPRGGIAVCSGGEIAMVRGLRHGMVHGGFPS